MDRITEKFYEWTMPELTTQLKRLNDNLEKLIPLFEKNPPKSFGEMNKEIKEGMDYIIRMRKQGLNK